MSIDREKHMSVDEVRTLRTVTEAQSVMDLRAGRVNGVLAWMVVDTREGPDHPDASIVYHGFNRVDDCT